MKTKFKIHQIVWTLECNEVRTYYITGIEIEFSGVEIYGLNEEDKRGYNIRKNQNQIHASKKALLESL